MDKHRHLRKFRRIPADELPDNLTRPVVLINHMEVKSSIVDLSPIGIGIEIDLESPLQEGDLFDVKFFKPDIDIRCICVFSEKNEKGIVVGAYFVNRGDHHCMLDVLGDKAVN